MFLDAWEMFNEAACRFLLRLSTVFVYVGLVFEILRLLAVFAIVVAGLCFAGYWLVKHLFFL
jgi:hypothetical protein